MFDKLEDLVKRLDEVMQELSEPDVVSDQNRFRNLMKEQNELAPIVEKYKEYNLREYFYARQTSKKPTHFINLRPPVRRKNNT